MTEEDFRDAAVRESLKRVQPDTSLNAVQAQLEDSVCLPADPLGQEALRKTELISLSLALGSLFVFGWCTWLAFPTPRPFSKGLPNWLADLDPGVPEWVLLTLAALVVLYCLVSGRVWSRITRSMLARRHDRLFDPFTQETIYVKIEDGETHTRLKLVPEDHGVCLLDPARRRILIEGFSHRYVIMGKDVLRLRRLRGFVDVGVLMTFRVGEERLEMTIADVGGGTIRKILSGVMSLFVSWGLHKRMVSTLKPQNLS